MTTSECPLLPPQLSRLTVSVVATNPNDPQASVGLNKCMEVLKRVEIVWPSAARAWELLHGAKDDLPDYEIPLTNIDRPRKRSADDPIDTILLGDPSHLHENRNGASTAPQAYAPTAINGQRYDPIVDIADSNRAFALFNSYARWASDGSLGFPSGLSTSVLPQHYSNGFDERLASGTHRSPGGLADGTGRFSQYWSDIHMGHPSSMLNSMYDLPLFANPHHHHDQHSQHASQGLPDAHSFTGTHPLYMNDHFNAFGELLNVYGFGGTRPDFSCLKILFRHLRSIAFFLLLFVCTFD